MMELIAITLIMICVYHYFGCWIMLSVLGVLCLLAAIGENFK